MRAKFMLLSCAWGIEPWPPRYTIAGDPIQSETVTFKHEQQLGSIAMREGRLVHDLNV